MSHDRDNDSATQIESIEQIISQACTDAIAAIVPPGDYPLDVQIIKDATAALCKTLEAALPEKQAMVAEASDLYERAEQLGHAEGRNAAIDQVRETIARLCGQEGNI